MRRLIGTKILLITSLFFITACNQSNLSNQPEKVKNQSTSIDVIYPHDIPFFKKHGQAYLQGQAQCLKCHGPESVATNPAVSCTSCHEAFPHKQNWAIKTEHAAAYIKNPQACASCHGVDGSGGTSQVSCKSCHDFPHDKKWAVPSNHGKAFVKTTDKSTCLSCHDSNRKDGYPPKCESCHEAFPQAHKSTNWKEDPSQPGHHKPFAKRSEGKCLACHTDYKANTPTIGEYGGCLMCHSGMKLEVKWIENPPPENPPDNK